MKSLKKALLAAAVGGLFAAGSASAATIPLYAGALNQLSDNSADGIINMAGAATVLDVGDRLHGIFNIESIENLSASGTTTLSGIGKELTGIFDITVVAKFGGPGAFTWVFAPTTSVYGNAIFGLGGLTGMAVGTAVAMWSSSTIDYTRIGCATQAACEATATNGALWATLGFGANSYWTASAITDNLAIIGLIPPPTPGGSYNAALDFYINNTGYVPTKSDCLDLTTITFKANDVCGSGSLLGKGGANSPYESFDNVDFTLRLVPEPGTLGLLGIALAGFGAASRRNKKQAA